ncbi:MAG: PSD1 and planctomycete cytochrome C domain-containing protein [Bacteroidales bacterium]|nr:PSD1 and planctomycete cytochrome C domain-containing protein [Bacteroidales bacterium]
MNASLYPVLTVGLALIVCIPAQAADSAGVEYFEKYVRPVLVEHCYRCHSEEAVKNGKLKGGLRLDNREAMRTGGDSGAAVVPGKPSEGTFLDSLSYTGDVQMPPKGKLPDDVIAKLKKWIEMGAPDARVETVKSIGSTINLEKGRTYWAFQAPVPAPTPRTIDQFLNAALQERHLNPVAPADRRTLIRRVFSDLWGLPPTPEAVDAFVQDTSPTAFQKVVEELLASPHYGERWARHWLDVARYAEDQAHTFAVKPKVGAYQYRDWVIAAFNRDLPFDQFVRFQIAGDQMPESSGDRFTRFAGLGFLGLGAEYYKNTAKEQAIADELDDRVDTLTRGFLGMTVACARCHDHKFDPIPQQDYYAIAGIFNGFSPATVPLVSEDVVKKYDAGQKQIAEQEAKITAFFQAISREKTQTAIPLTAQYLVTTRDIAEKRRKGEKFDAAAIARTTGLDQYILGRWGNFLTRREAQNVAAFQAWLHLKPGASPAEIQHASATAAQAVITALEKTPSKTSPSKATVELAKLLNENANSPFVIPAAECEKRYLTESHKPELAKLRTELEARKKAAPSQYAVAHTIQGGGRTMPVFIRGNPLKHGDLAPKGFLQVAARPGAETGEQFTRLDLANAIADPQNPLTARVIVNRVWAWHFGRGLVNTPSNFGSLGDRPSHPELLDDLTTRFVAHGWSLKWLHREILSSAAYQRASTADPRNEATDPENIYLWRSNRRSLDVEAWRDNLLAVAGTLDPTIGGPTFNLADPTIHRRTVYAKISRHDLNGLLRLFDFPDANVTSDRRTQTTVPQQQLFALNSEFMIGQARAFAERVQQAGSTEQERITQAYRLAFGRKPDANELRLGMAFLQRKPTADDKLTPWQQYAQILLATNELMYID